MKNLLAVLLLIWGWHITHAQINVTASFNKDTIVIGQYAELTLSVELQEGVTLGAVSAVFLDSMYSALQTYKKNPNADTSQTVPPQLSDFEYVDDSTWVDNNDDQLFTTGEWQWEKNQLANNTKLWEHTFKFRFWDPGVNIAMIPPVFYIQDNESQLWYQQETVSIFVGPPDIALSHPDSLEIADIKPIVREARNLSDFLLYIYILAAVLLLATMFFVIRWWLNKQDKTDQELAPVVPPSLPADIKALKDLQSLREAELWQKGEVKAYQSRLTFIVREYLENRYRLPALESTTQEIVQRLEGHDLDIQDVQSLRKILQVADLVKFAKATPEADIHEQFMDEAVSFVKRTAEAEEEPDGEQ